MPILNNFTNHGIDDFQQQSCIKGNGIYIDTAPATRPRTETWNLDTQGDNSTRDPDTRENYYTLVLKFVL